jgi:hypothetical protein
MSVLFAVSEVLLDQSAMDKWTECSFLNTG